MFESPLLLMVVLMVVMFLVVTTATQHRRYSNMTQQKLCRGCGAAHPGYAAFCRRCGRKLDA